MFHLGSQKDTLHFCFRVCGSPSWVCLNMDEPPHVETIPWMFVAK